MSMNQNQIKSKMTYQLIESKRPTIVWNLKLLLKRSGNWNQRILTNQTNITKKDLKATTLPLTSHV